MIPSRWNLWVMLAATVAIASSASAFHEDAPDAPRRQLVNNRDIQFAQTKRQSGPFAFGDQRKWAHNSGKQHQTPISKSTTEKTSKQQAAKDLQISVASAQQRRQLDRLIELATSTSDGAARPAETTTPRPASARLSSLAPEVVKPNEQPRQSSSARQRAPHRSHKLRGALAEQQQEQELADEPPLDEFSGLDRFEPEPTDRGYPSPVTHARGVLGNSGRQVAAGRSREIEGAPKLTLAKTDAQPDEHPNSVQQSAFIDTEGFPGSPSAFLEGGDYTAAATSVRHRRPAQIRVVFNNNPQFVIGKEHANLHNGDGLAEQQFRRGSNLNGGDHYVSDESSMDETKVATEGRPCNKDRQQKSTDFEQIDLSQQEHQVPEMALKPPVKVPQVKTKTPPVQVKQPLAVKQAEQDEPTKGADEQVDTPFEQIVKSGMRPPLRMIVSMRNKNGDTMKVPVNLHGSTEQLQQVSVMDLGQQRQVYVEQPVHQSATKQQSVDENTPVGGDVFDPSIVKPFTKTLHQATVAPAKVPQQTVRDEPQQVEKSPPHQQQRVEPETKELGSKAADCEHQDQADDDDQQQQHHVILGSTGDTLQMVVPKVTQFSNRTFANMFKQFHKALAEQMAGQEQQPQEEVKQQQQDDQEDLMVAMMAANPSESAQGVERGVTMTVIKPPKGTSLQAAIQQAQSSPEPGKTVAILHTVKSKLGGSSPASEAPLESPSPPVAVDVEIRGPNSNSATVGPDSPDQDGFASSSSPGENYSQNSRAQPKRSRAFERLMRFKRAGNESSPYGRLLEDADKLAAQAHRMLKDSQFALSAREHSSSALQELKREADRGAQANNTSSTTTTRRPSAAKTAEPSPKRKPAGDKKKPVKAAKGANGKPSKSKPDLIEVAASEQAQQNEVMDGDDEDDESAPSADGNEEASMAAPTASESDPDEESTDLGDDNEDNANFDADDEPYNQGAPSERDYNSPSFEIPQIDINPDSLKQKGCKTVLREVQEIPMNGLGVEQANGQPGSGYLDAAASNQVSARQYHLPGLRVRRQAGSNDNLINSRKVTSIVMTKECHFPNDSPEPAAGSKRQSAERQPDNRQAQHSHAVAQQRMVAPVSLDSTQSQQANRMVPYQRQGYLGKRPEAQAERGQQGYAPSLQVNRNLIQAAQQYELARHPGLLQLHTRLMPIPMAIQMPHQQVKRRSVALQLPPSPTTTNLQRAPGPTNQAQKQGPQENRNQQLQRLAMLRPHQLEKDFYEGADSRRNEVVARKLYKPPSAEDPFHTLSYSSQNGADPDRDEEEDEGFLVEKEDKEPAPRTAASMRQRARASETLSESERQALLDPNYDDTDPVSSHPRPDDDPLLAPEHPDADESDVDLMDESRAHSARREVPSAIKRAASQARARQPQPAREGPSRQAAAPVRRSSAEPDRFGKSFRFTHELGRPQARGLRSQLRNLKPGRQEFVHVERGPMQQASKPAARRINRRDEDADERDDDGYSDRDEADDDGEPSATSRRRAQAEPASAGDDEDDPDADPEYNPKETHLPAHSKPKKVHKSFAYVHRDVPKKGAKDSDDFVVSYGRGNLQTEHEDYDSDRENSPRPQEAQAAEGSALKASRISLANRGWPLQAASTSTAHRQLADQSASDLVAKQQRQVNLMAQQRVAANAVGPTLARLGRAVSQPVVLVAQSQYPHQQRQQPQPQQRNHYQQEAFRPSWGYLAAPLMGYR